MKGYYMVRVWAPNAKQVELVTEGSTKHLSRGDDGWWSSPDPLRAGQDYGFKVDGSDLRVDLPITLYEAVLGSKVRVPTLGGAVELSIPKNTSSGRTFRLKGKGLPKSGGNGDLLVTTKIILPDGNDSELEQLMQKWRNGHPYNPRNDLG